MLEHRSRLLRLFRGHADHFMRDCSGEYDHHIRRTDLILEVGGKLGENLAFTSVFSADFFVTAVHTVMTADNDDAHLFISLMLTYS